MFEEQVRSLYDPMARIVLTPEWVKVLGFETRAPDFVHQLAAEKGLAPPILAVRVVIELPRGGQAARRGTRGEGQATTSPRKMAPCLEGGSIDCSADQGAAMASITSTRNSTPHAVAAWLAAVGAVLLAVKAARTFGPDQYGTVEPIAGLFVVLIAGLALAAAITALRAPRSAGLLMLGAVAGSLIADQLPTAPPRLVPLIPLAIAAGLMFVSPAVAAIAARRPGWATALGWLGIALHAAVGWPYLVSGLVAPVYGVLLLWTLWAALLVVALRQLRQRPAWTPVVPAVAAGLWFLVMYLGEAVLGWHP